MRKVLKDFIKSDISIENKYLVAKTPINLSRTKYQNYHLMSYHEEDMMNQIADIIVKPNGSVLNVGYGLGIFDKQVQKIGVLSHTIIECHPKIVEMCDLEDVEMIHSTWQDYVPKLIEQKRKFDTIWFDTFLFNGPCCFKYEWDDFTSYVDDLLEVNGIISMFTNKFPKHFIKNIKTSLDMFKLQTQMIDEYELLFWIK